MAVRAIDAKKGEGLSSLKLRLMNDQGCYQKHGYLLMKLGHVSRIF